ncbi:GlxA family transcriptional regulator [Marinobacter sp. NP-4(2019)]|uniref:GlxA family transcriptional regulator n=1 Tax=Marinobacter sp. NP-4(2019) TaxID=2488665 RepID=UPI000FC3CA6F|nr:GlxA family transcriptional regulator [Marinobacter sp. NP-4(2019)]AZT83827.1 GlxA family transcriptional regulator [Marinobacter sp. NP-4(2019)]
MTSKSAPSKSPGTLPGEPRVKTPLRIGFILREHFSMVTFTAAVDTLVTTNLITPEPVFEHFTVGTGSRTVLSDLGIEVSTGTTLDSLAIKPGHVDMLIVCGGYRSQLDPEPYLLNTLRTANQKGIRLGGLWNGGVSLVQAGLMEHHACALHPDNHAYVRENFPNVKVSTNAYEIEDHHATCAGPVSALEMMLKLIGELLHNPHIVRAVREILSCDQVAEQVGPMPLNMGDDPTLPEALQTLLALMRANIEEPLSLLELSECANISRRQVERLFQNHLDTSPSRYYLELRLVHARRLLMQTNRSILNISLASGFVSSSHFSNCFKDYYGITPSEARHNRQ